MNTNKTYSMKKVKNEKLAMAGISTLAPIRKLTTIALLAFLAVGCSKKQEAQTTAEAVKVKEITIGTDGATACSQDAYGYSGTVEEENGTSLSFTTGGTILQLKVKVGDRVRKGQLIATVEPTQVKNTYEMAHATRMQAEDAYGRMKQLHDKGSLTELKWVEAQSQLQQAVAAEGIAKKSLADCALHAPFDGVVSEKYAEVGQNAAPGMPIVKLVTTKVLNVKISVPESEMANVRVRQRARIAVQALGGKQYEGYVIEKGVIADPISRSYNVKIRVEGTDNALLPGMVAQVALDGADASKAGTAAKAAVVIPAHLVQLGDDNSNFVWVDEGGKAVRRTIVCGEYQSNGVSIVSGLKTGDRLIVEGQQKVSNGTMLKVKK